MGKKTGDGSTEECIQKIVDWCKANPMTWMQNVHSDDYENAVADGNPILTEKTFAERRLVHEVCCDPKSWKRLEKYTDPTTGEVTRTFVIKDSVTTKKKYADVAAFSDVTARVYTKQDGSTELLVEMD